MVRIAVCESSGALLADMEAAFIELGRMLQGTFEYECFTGGLDLLKELDRGERFQAVYLNMELCDMDGVELAGKLRQLYSGLDFILVYLSPQESFRRLVFDTRPFDVLPVPFDRSVYFKNMIAVIEQKSSPANFFLYKKGRVTYQIKKSDIIYLESIKQEILLSTVNGDAMYYGTLKNEVPQLSAVNFIHPHQAFILNLDYVAQYHNKSLLTLGGKRIPISELRLKETKEAVLRYWEYNHLR